VPPAQEPPPDPSGSLYVFSHVLDSRPARAVRAVLAHATAGRLAEAHQAWCAAFARLAEEGWAGDAWRAHLASRVVRDWNPFTRAAEPPAGLEAAARHDLAALERWTSAPFWEAVRRRLAEEGDEPLPWHGLGTRTPSGLAAELYAGHGWAAWASALAAHARAGGAGPFAEHLAYRWVRRGGCGRLVPVRDPDLVPLDGLVGYEEQKQALLANTERFVRGLPALDVLLYGDRGTGKSSLVRAMLHRVHDQGLRLVALGRRDLADLPELAARLAGMPQRFIVFVDDLSFEEHETGYKEAKGALEGGVAARPRNVLVYATSNRRHLVRERLSERGRPGDDDPRAADAVEEKLSLSDRFGLTLTFVRPDQTLYLEMVASWARTRGVALPEEELRAQALRWARWQNGMSGRTARQFVDSLVASAG
jgi:predicted AAA+ superfamily ATPase